MDPKTATIIAVISAVIGGLGLLFGVYSHIRTHKIAKLIYGVSQLSDFDVPVSFLQDLPRAPVAVTITSLGNKGTENIVLHMKAKSEIDDYSVSPEGLDVSIEGQSLELKLERLNPSQQIKVFLRCTGSPWQDQVESFDLTHSEGAAQNEQAVQKLVFDFLGLEIEYDLKELRPYVTRIGPVRLARSYGNSASERNGTSS